MNTRQRRTDAAQREADTARILTYPPMYRRTMAGIARREGRWPHVDWEAVEASLGDTPEADENGGNAEDAETIESTRREKQMSLF